MHKYIVGQVLKINFEGNAHHGKKITVLKLTRDLTGALTYKATSKEFEVTGNILEKYLIPNSYRDLFNGFKTGGKNE